VAKAIEKARAEMPDLPEVRTFIEFVEQSKRGVTR
jgi:UDP-N-acetylglucosamine acyltransferase